MRPDNSERKEDSTGIEVTSLDQNLEIHHPWEKLSKGELLEKRNDKSQSQDNSIQSQGGSNHGDKNDNDVDRKKNDMINVYFYFFLFSHCWLKDSQTTNNEENEN